MRASSSLRRLCSSGSRTSAKRSASSKKRFFSCSRAASPDSISSTRARLALVWLGFASDLTRRATSEGRLTVCRTVLSTVAGRSEANHGQGRRGGGVGRAPAYASSCSRVHASTESSSNTCSTTAYGGPWSQLGSSVMCRCSVRFDLSFGSTATLTTSCGSSEMATTTREPTSVQRQRLPPHQNSRPMWKSLRFIGDKYSALRRRSRRKKVALVREVEEDAAAQREATGKPVLGRAAVLKQQPREWPNRPEEVARSACPRRPEGSPRAL